MELAGAREVRRDVDKQILCSLRIRTILAGDDLHLLNRELAAQLHYRGTVVAVREILAEQAGDLRDGLGGAAEVVRAPRTLEIAEGDAEENNAVRGLSQRGGPKGRR